MRVNLNIKAKKHCNKIQLIVSLPPMTKLYEHFIKEPSKIDRQNGKLTWNIEKLNAGEERSFSYIVYSKLNIVGRFELPAAVSFFEVEGKPQRVLSNKAFFASEKADA